MARIQAAVATAALLVAYKRIGVANYSNTPLAGYSGVAAITLNSSIGFPRVPCLGGVHSSLHY